MTVTTHDGPHRPSYHLTAWKNWCNDPNGLVCVDGVFHAFYQHNPDAQTHGPMHWGHATSRDLYRWEHRPIALFPTSEGTCFSGSAVWDPEHTTGLTDGPEAPIVLHYTLHPHASTDGRHMQEQHMAYSTDGVTFHPYAGNPVLPNQGEADFRDPKIIRYAPGEVWVSAIAAGDRIAFYRSEDQRHWVHSGDFGPGEGSIEGVWECPDLFPLTFGDETYWVLLVSMATDEAAGRSVTQYFIGSFDGYRFTADEGSAAPADHADAQPAPSSRLFDEGTDQYATVGFYGVPHPVVMGWAMNWGYAEATPTTGYCGQMTAPRQPYLYRGIDGRVALAQWPVPIPGETVLRRRRADDASGTLDGPLDGNPLILSFTPDAETPSFAITFSNEAGDVLRITQDEARTLTVDRSGTGLPEDVPMLAHTLYRKRTVPARTAEPGAWLLMLDGPVLEVYGDGGTRTVTMLSYPRTPYRQISVRGLPGATLSELRSYTAPLPEDPYRNAPIFAQEAKRPEATANGTATQT